MALLAGGAALALAGCTGDDGPTRMSKSIRALSPKTLALIQEKNMTVDSPIVVRIYKEESELEVWKETTSGDYALLKTYPICRWSGELGPKVKEGDRQAPEGFYTITPGQMNPNSQYYLSFDLGFPNAYDKAWGRSGSNLMVHGDCSSRGCYAMTDEQVQEIFSLGRESFGGGQRAFQVQAYPFRMTAENMVRHRNNPNLAFWKMLKEGSDTFELTKAPPRVDYCGKRYVFNATPTDPGQRFQASAPCPDYTQPEGLAEAIASRQKDVATRIASAGSQPSAPVKTGKDGGMHKVFLAKLANPELTAPGSLPPIVKPPGSEYGVETNAPAPEDTIALATADVVPAATDVAASAGGRAANVPLPEPRPADIPGDPGTQLAAAPGNGVLGARSPAVTAPGMQVAALETGGGGLLDTVKSWFGSGSNAPAAAPASASGPSSGPSAGSSALANAGFSFSSLFGGGSAAPAPAPEAQAADVPVPPARPPARQLAARAPAVNPAAQRPVAASITAPATHPARAAAPQPAAPQPAAAPAQGYAAVPPPGPAAYTTVPTPAAASQAGAGPQLRPSVAATSPDAGTPAGASSPTPGSVSPSAQ